MDLKLDFKDNKNLLLVVILAALILVLGLAGYFVTRGQAGDAAKEFEAQKLAAQSASQPPVGTLSPIAANVEALGAQKEASFAAVEALQQELKPYTFASDGSDYPEAQTVGEVEVQSIDTETFQPFLQSVYEQRRDALEEIGAQTEEGFFLGMENYRADRPRSVQLARFLAYELAAIDAVLEVLTKAGVKSVSVSRTRSGPEVVRSSADSDNADTEGEEVVVADYHPIRIQFTGRQQALQDAINFLANDKRYFYQLHDLSVRNESLEAPTVSDVEGMLANLKTNEGGGFGGGDGNQGGGFGSGGFGGGGNAAETTAETTEDQASGFASTEDSSGEDGGFGSRASSGASGAAAASSAPEIAVQPLGAENITVTLDIFLVTFRPLAPVAEEEPADAAAVEEEAAA